MSSRLEEYAVIGDTMSAALVAENGSIDWRCVPRFDPAACFAALLETPDNGRCRIAPIGDHLRTERHYRADRWTIHGYSARWLFAEEFDPISKRQVGNFPQAYSRVSLINSARNLASANGTTQQPRTT